MTLIEILVAFFLGCLLGGLATKPLWQGMFARRVRQLAPVPARRPGAFSDSMPPGRTPNGLARLPFQGASRAGPRWGR